jgi:tetratricopeptide (TPR) repeat protein
MTDNSEARKLFGQSLELFRDLGADWDVCWVLKDLAYRSWEAGATDDARMYLDQALELADAIGDSITVTFALRLRGRMARASGEYQQAMELQRQALQLARDICFPRGIRWAMDELAYTSVLLGRRSEAIDWLTGSMRFGQDELSLPTTDAECTLALVDMLSGNYEHALRRLSPALSQLQSDDDLHMAGWPQFVIGAVLMAQGAFGAAEEALEASASTYRESGVRMGTGSELAMLAGVRCMLGHVQAARQDLVDALDLCQETGHHLTSIYAAAGAALWSAQRGAAKGAVELYELVCTHPCLGGTPWIHDAIGRHIDQAAASLQHDVIARARERGRARELHATVDELWLALEQGRGLT